MKKLKNKLKSKRNSSKVRKFKEGRRRAMSMVNTVVSVDKRIARLERITNKILDNIGAVGEYIQASEGRLKELERSRWERFKNFILGRKG